MITAICFVAYLLYVWFKTDAFVEYANLLKLGSILKVKEYQDLEYPESFPDFLYEHYNNFVTRLLHCPVCLSFWLGGLTALFAGLTAWPVATFFGLLGYRLLDKLF